MIGGWLIRRLSPDSNPIEIDDLPNKRDERKLLHAMGKEVGNVHLGERKQHRRILQDMRRRQKNWLRRAAKQMAGITERELVEAWNTTPALRHSFVQNLMADGVKFRISQRALSQRRANPVPHLQRPGISEPARIDDGAVSAALARLNAPGGSEGRIGLKNAAALVAARRGNRR